LEDMLVQIDEMGIEHGYDVDRVLWLGRQLERTVGKRLRSEAVINGRTLQEGTYRICPARVEKSLKRKWRELGPEAAR
jgi:hydroxymethylglutaryl-CoA lyase